MSSPKSSRDVRYTIECDDGATHSFTVHVRRGPPSLKVMSDAPHWTVLTSHQCPGCPLASTGATHCPTAVDLVDIVTPFNEMVSFDRAKVTVETPERTIVGNVDVQTALRSLLGLVMASSQCPVLGELRGLAEFHLPFATPEEATYRATANHLLKQFFRAKHGEETDMSLDSLRDYYATLQELNRAFVDRLRAAAKKDANLNALVLLFSEAALVQLSLDADLSNLEPIFRTGASPTDDE